VSAPRRITVDTIDHGRIEIDEPSWCIVDHGRERPGYRADITHNGAPIAADVESVRGTERILEACISWSPFAELLPEPHPVLALGDLPPMDPDEAREAAAELGLFIGKLYSLSNQLYRLRRAES